MSIALHINAESEVGEGIFFFELCCCARHYNCGSHWAVLVLSLLDNEIKRKGQGPRKTRQTKPPNNTQKTPSRRLAREGVDLRSDRS